MRETSVEGVVRVCVCVVAAVVAVFERSVLSVRARAHAGICVARAHVSVLLSNIHSFPGTFLHSQTLVVRTKKVGAKNQLMSTAASTLAPPADMESEETKRLQADSDAVRAFSNPNSHDLVQD